MSISTIFICIIFCAAIGGVVSLVRGKPASAQCGKKGNVFSFKKHTSPVTNTDGTPMMSNGIVDINGNILGCSDDDY